MADLNTLDNKINTMLKLLDELNRDIQDFRSYCRIQSCSQCDRQSPECQISPPKLKEVMI